VLAKYLRQPNEIYGIFTKMCLLSTPCANSNQKVKLFASLTFSLVTLLDK